jgi:ubiquitin-protein ligase
MCSKFNLSWSPGMNALDIRKREDLAKVRDLCQKSGGKIEFVFADSDAATLIQLRLHYKTAGSRAYPDEVLKSIELKIQIPSGYPFKSPPVATLKPVVYHPNVYPSGQVCLGSKWTVSEFLDLLVKRVIRIVTYQEDVMNELSPANGEAVTWYRNQKRQHPRAFPTDSASTIAAPVGSGISWKNVK